MGIARVIEIELPQHLQSCLRMLPTCSFVPKLCLSQRQATEAEIAPQLVASRIGEVDGLSGSSDGCP